MLEAGLGWNTLLTCWILSEFSTTLYQRLIKYVRPLEFLEVKL
jgi:hypothetical protein